jgi:hypothetical protein
MKHPAPRRAAVALVSVFTIFVGLATHAGASPNPNPRWYRPNISPKPLSAGAVSTLTFTITNGYNSAHSLGSANINVPTGFTIVGGPSAPVLSGDETWSSSLSGSGRIIQLRNPGPSKSQRLNFGESVQVSFDVKVPCDAGSYAWTSQVRITNDFSNNGKNFTISPGLSNPRTTVSGPCANHLAFNVQPSETLANATMSPAVTVDVLDSSNNVVSADNSTQVTLTIGANPGGGTLTGGDATTVVNGVASFAGLSIDNSSSGYTLKADAPTLTGDTSVEFAITSTDSSCTDCTATFPNGTSTVSGPPGTTLIIETNQLDCAQLNDPIAGTVTIIPDPDTVGATAITFDDEIPFPVEGSYPFCKTPNTDQNVPFCDSIDNGLDQNPDGVACVTETVILHGSGNPTLHSILYIDANDPGGKH